MFFWGVKPGMTIYDISSHCCCARQSANPYVRLSFDWAQDKRAFGLTCAIIRHCEER